MAHRRLDWKVVLALGLAGVWLGRRLTRPRYDLRGKTVLISDGARGLGLALARGFGARGGRLALLSGDGAELARAAAELRAEGLEVRVFPCDVRLSDQVQQAVHEVVDVLGPIDVLVNNAGSVELGPRPAMLLSDYQEAMDADFFGPLSLVQAVLPAMRARGEGRIVNVASRGGKVPTPHRLPAVASKFALVGFSEGLHAEVKRDGVVVTTVCPGRVRNGSTSPPSGREKRGQPSVWLEVLASLPFDAIGADAAARAIVRACELGTPEVILTAQARAASRLHGVAPGLTAKLLAGVRGRRGSRTPSGREQRTGLESESPLSRSAVTGVTREAEQRNSELP